MDAHIATGHSAVRDASVVWVVPGREKQRVRFEKYNVLYRRLCTLY